MDILLVTAALLAPVQQPQPGPQTPQAPTAPAPGFVRASAEGYRLPASAILVVRLPADAALTVDGAPTRSTSALRTFRTPPLPPDRTFWYTLKATARRAGRTVTETKRVAVRGGEDTEVELTLPAPDAGPK